MLSLCTDREQTLVLHVVTKIKSTPEPWHVFCLFNRWSDMHTHLPNAPHTFHVHFSFFCFFCYSFFSTKYDLWSDPGEGHKVNSSWRYSAWKCIYPCWPQSLSDLTYLVFVTNASGSFSLLIKCDDSWYLINGQMWLRNCNCQPVRPSLCFLTSPAVKILVGLITVQRVFFFS